MQIMQSPIDHLDSIDRNRINAFLKRFPDDSYLWFACHAAFPPAITSDLLYKIWLNVNPVKSSSSDGKANSPVIIADLLNSSICRELGHDLYEIYPEIQQILLKELKLINPLGHVQMAQFIQDYLLYNPDKIPNLAFKEALEFTALSHLKPDVAAQNILDRIGEETTDTGARIKIDFYLNAIKARNNFVRSNNAQAGPDALLLTEDIIKSIKLFKEGLKEQAVEQLRPLESFINAQEGQRGGLRCQIPDEVLQELKPDVITEILSNKNNKYYQKIHLLADESMDQVALAEQLFGVTIQGDQESFWIYPWEAEVYDRENNKLTCEFQVWHWTSKVPHELDRLLMSFGAISIAAAPNYEENGALITRLRETIDSEVIFRIEPGISEKNDQPEIDQKIKTLHIQSVLKFKHDEINAFQEKLLRASQELVFRPFLMPPIFLDKLSLINKYATSEEVLTILNYEDLPDNLNAIQQGYRTGIFAVLPEYPEVVICRPMEAIRQMITILNKVKKKKKLLSRESSGSVFLIFEAMGLCDDEDNFDALISSFPSIEFSSIEISVERYTFEYLPKDLWIRLLSFIRFLGFDVSTKRNPTSVLINGFRLEIVHLPNESSIEFRLRAYEQSLASTFSKIYMQTYIGKLNSYLSLCKVYQSSVLMQEAYKQLIFSPHKIDRKKQEFPYELEARLKNFQDDWLSPTATLKSIHLELIKLKNGTFFDYYDYKNTSAASKIFDFVEGNRVIPPRVPPFLSYPFELKYTRQSRKESLVTQLPEDKPQANRTQGKNYILAIAIDDYQHCPKLNNSVSDVRDFIGVMTSLYQFETVNVTFIVNAEATKRHIERAFDDLIDLIEPEDNLIVYFSGHGRYHKRRGGYWVPVDAGEGDKDWSDYISNNQIKYYVGKIKSFHTFLIVDSCFSGSLFVDNSKENFSSDFRDTEPSRWGLTSGKNEIVSDGQPGTNSPFATVLLDVLRKADQPLGIMRICDLVLEKVAANAEQTPIGAPIHSSGHRGGQMVLYRKNEKTIPNDENDQLNVKHADAIKLELEIKEQAWQKVIESPSQEDLSDFIKRYGSSLQVQSKAANQILIAILDPKESSKEPQTNLKPLDNLKPKTPRDLVRRDRERDRPGKNYLLAIAIDDYQHIPKISNAVRDVEAFIKIMTTRYQFEPQYITFIKDAEATKRRIEQAFMRLIKVVTPRDNLIVYFSGHGRHDEHFSGNWVPVDAGSAEDDWPDYLSNSLVKDYLNKIKSFHTFVIVDSCFSGSLLIDKGKEKFSGDRRDSEPSRWGLTSGKKEIVSDEVPPGRHGPFANALLDVLRNADQPLSVKRICDLVLDKVAANANQTPMGAPLMIPGHQGGQMVLYPKHDANKWENESKSICIDSYKEYIQTGKDEVLIEEAWWRIAALSDSEEDCNKYVERYPQGLFHEEALELITWIKVRVAGNLMPLLGYFRDNPDSPYNEVGQRYIDALRESAAISLIEEKHEEGEEVVPDHMVLVKGGTFQMGEDKEAHQVTLNDFLIAKHQLTFDEYDAFCKATGRELPKDERWGRSNRPVINVNWFDVVNYCNWRSQQEGFSEVYQIKQQQVDANWQANGYRLPTEAEWEFAARGGQKSQGFEYSGSNNADEVAWYEENSGDETHPVGEKKANELGLYDLSGNVWEWCGDWYGDYPSKATNDPKGPDTGSYRVLRGGSWDLGAGYCRVAIRSNDAPSYADGFYGFRLARTF